MVLWVDAIDFNSLPGLRKLLPDGDLNKMLVRATLGIPSEYTESLDKTQVIPVFPYGTVEVVVKEGGLLGRAGIVLPERGDPDGVDTIIVVIACVEVGL